MKDELEASMRAVVALACAFEGYHSLILTSSGSTEPELRSKAQRIISLLSAEVMGHSRATDQLREVVTRVFKLRNRAVHFDSAARRPLARSDMPGAVHDPYHAWFTGMEAERLAKKSLQVFGDLVDAMSDSRSIGVRAASLRSRTRLNDDVIGTPECRALISPGKSA